MRRVDRRKREDDNARPRHIRDIAHLYMSRRDKPRETTAAPAAINLFMTSCDAGCLSGFHAANLAAAFAHCRAHVRVFELSGLLPNASFYFGHPAALYMDTTQHGRRKLLPALPAVSVAFDERARPRPHTERGPVVNLFHLPPDSVMNDWSQVFSEKPGAGWRLHLCLGTREPGAVTGGPELHDTFVVAVDEQSEEKCPMDPSSVIEDWRWAIVDRMPIVVRDPASRLARTYVATCESLLARMVTTKRNEHGQPQYVEPPQARAVASGRTRGRDISGFRR